MAYIVSSSFELSGKVNVFEVGLENDTEYEYSIDVRNGDAEINVEAFNYDSDTWDPISSDGSFAVPAVKMNPIPAPPRYRMKFLISKTAGGTDAEYTFTLNKR